MADAYGRLIGALRDNGLTVYENADRSGAAQAPGHSPADRSLTFRHITPPGGDGQVLIHSHAGEETADVLDALGLTLADLFDSPRGVEYAYPDGRIKHRTTDKKFRQSGRIKLADNESAELYRADQIGSAATVFVTEGEKDADALAAVGVAAVSTPGGDKLTTQCNWEPLRDRAVVIVQDRDPAGRKRARQALAMVAELATSARIVEPATGNDAADHIAAGHRVDEFVSAPFVSEHRADTAALLAGQLPPPPVADIATRADGKCGLFYRGTVNMVFGDPECGKTWLALAACVEVLREPGTRAAIVDLDHNGHAQTVERLLSVGAPAVALADPRRFAYFDIDDLAALADVVADVVAAACDLVIVDSVGELIPIMGGSSNDADDFRRINRQTLRPIAKSGAAVLAIDHLSKGADSRAYGASGTVAKRAAADGAVYRVQQVTPFVRGHGGAASMALHKDRHGGVRPHCEPGSREPLAAVFELSSETIGGVVTTAGIFRPPHPGERPPLDTRRRDDEPTPRDDLRDDLAALARMDHPPTTRDGVRRALGISNARAGAALTEYRRLQEQDSDR